MALSFKKMTPWMVAGLLFVGAATTACSPEYEEDIQTPQGETEVESEPGELEQEVDTPDGEVETETDVEEAPVSPAPASP